jgi:hypothetical protein
MSYGPNILDMYRRVGGIAENWPNAFFASVLMSDDRSAVSQTNDF